MKLKEYIVWLTRVSHGMRWRIALNSLSGMAHVALSLSFIWICKRLVDIATGDIEGSFSTYAIAMGCCVIMQLLVSVVGSRVGVLTEMRMTNMLRQKLFTRIMESRWLGREQMHTGDMLNRLEGDVATVADLVCRVVPAVLVTLTRLSAAFVFLLLLDWRLALILSCIMPLALLMSKSYMMRMRRLTKEIRATDSKVQAHLQENLQHRTLISSLEQRSNVADALEGLQFGLYQQVKNRNTYSLFSRSVVQFGFAAGYSAAFLWGVAGLYSGAITFGMVTAFLQLVNQVQRPIVDLGSQLPSFIRGFIAVERLDEIAKLPAEEQGEPIRLSGVPGVRMNDVTFTYHDGNSAVIEHFSHDFKPGSMTAVVGETGVGKSTMMRLILALLLPDSGRISFYNHEREVTASPMTRCNIVYVPQGNTLLTGSIRDNLLLGNPEATDAELRQALHIAVADFVHDLPDGLDSRCGELGAGLSEGQAQRIAIARGLLRPGGVLLLDEPTSSLDKDTERMLLKRLSENIGNRTLIIVTHRDAISQMCADTVWVSRNSKLNPEQ